MPRRTCLLASTSTSSSAPATPTCRALASRQSPVSATDTIATPTRPGSGRSSGSISSSCPSPSTSATTVSASSSTATGLVGRPATCKARLGVARQAFPASLIREAGPGGGLAAGRVASTCVSTGTAKETGVPLSRGFVREGAGRRRRHGAAVGRRPVPSRVAFAATASPASAATAGRRRGLVAVTSRTRPGATADRHAVFVFVPSRAFIFVSHASRACLSLLSNKSRTFKEAFLGRLFRPEVEGKIFHLPRNSSDAVYKTSQQCPTFLDTFFEGVRTRFFPPRHMNIMYYLVICGRDRNACSLRLDSPARLLSFSTKANLL